MSHRIPLNLLSRLLLFHLSLQGLHHIGPHGVHVTALLLVLDQVVQLFLSDVIIDLSILLFLVLVLVLDGASHPVHVGSHTV